MGIEAKKSKRSILEWILFILGKVGNFLRVFMFLDVALVIFWALPFKLLKWGQYQHPLFYAVIITLSFIYFILSISYVRRKKFYKGFDKKSVLGILFPVLLIIAIVGVGVNCFAALSSILNDHGHVSFSPQLMKHDLNATSNFYLWQFLDLIPQIKVNQTLHWELPFKSNSNLQNWLLLLFKIIMIWIVIALFYKWNKWRKEEAKTENVEATKSI